MESGYLQSRLHTSLPYDTQLNSISQDLASNNKLQGVFKSGIGNKKVSAKSGSIMMPTMNKIYNNGNTGLGD